MNVFVSLMQKPSVKNSYFEIVATIFQVSVMNLTCTECLMFNLVLFAFYSMKTLYFFFWGYFRPTGATRGKHIQSRRNNMDNTQN